MINKILTYTCLFLLAACVFLVFLLIHKNTVITSMERSIEHGAAIQRIRLEMDSTEAARIERDRQRAVVNIAKIEELKALLNEPRPTRPPARNKRELRDSFHRALDTR